PRDRLEAQLRLVDLLEFDDERKHEAVTLLTDAAKLSRESFEDPTRAAELLERASEMTDGNPAILHELLELHSGEKRWREATKVLARLAAQQADPLAQAKYLYAAGALMRDEQKDIGQAMGWMQRVLELDPTHEKAFRFVVDRLEAEQDPKALSRVLRARLKATPEDDKVARLALFDQLGALYEVDL